MSLPDPAEGIPDNSDTLAEAGEEKGGTKDGRGLIPQAHGGALLPGGTPGQKGGTGRPRKAFKEFAREFVETAEFQASMERRALKQATVAKMLLDHGAGVPAVPIDMQHSLDPAALDRLFAKLAPPADPTLPPAEGTP